MQQNLRLANAMAIHNGAFFLLIVIITTANQGGR